MEIKTAPPTGDVDRDDESLLADLIARLCAGDTDGRDEIEAIARARPEALRPFHDQLIDAEVWRWPPLLWFAASEETAGRLVDQIDADSPIAERWLLALGSTRTRTAAEALARWTAEPPAVTDQLYVPIARYAHGGGWETENGEIRALTTLAAFALTPTDSEQPLAGSMPLDAQCPWCGMPLVRRLDVDLDDPRSADLGLAGRGHGRVVAMACVGCGGFTHTYSEYRADGTVTWSPHNIRPDILDKLPADYFEDFEIPPQRLGLGPRRASPVAASAWDEGGSTLGGLPDWIDDSTYPGCPQCRRTMHFLAMLTGPDLWGEAAEGCDYVFFCAANCGIAAVGYQQS